jgi:hypothetical protein
MVRYLRISDKVVNVIFIGIGSLPKDAISIWGGGNN